MPSRLKGPYNYLIYLTKKYMLHCFDCYYRSSIKFIDIVCLTIHTNIHGLASKQANKYLKKTFLFFVMHSVKQKIKTKTKLEKRKMEKQNETKNLANLANEAQAILEEKLSFIENAVEETTVHTVGNTDKEEQELKKAMQEIMTSKGLVSANVPPLFFQPETEWKEILRKRLVAIIECHRPGDIYNVRFNDLDIREFKTVRSGNSKVQVEVTKEQAISKFVAQLMSMSKDKSEKLVDGTYKITKAINPADFTIKAPTTRRPFLEICFDMGK